MIHPSDIGARRYAHQAMHTEFEIFCVHDDDDYARQAAWAAFDLLDRLENELSRFIPNSDVSRINDLASGECVRVSRWTMECLELARAAFRETGGAFDISLGTGLEKLELARRDWTVRATADSVRLDLGGIGKGYAIDRMAEVLDEWDIRQALIHGGHSSVLALDAPAGLDGWPLTMGPRTIAARRQALSASGIRVQGEHIVDPRTGRRVSGRMTAWVSMPLDGGASPGAVAEAYSTAFMILPVEESAAIRARHAGMEAWFLESTVAESTPATT
jgi:thiamine biosynthesis lipoprotein